LKIYVPVLPVVSGQIRWQICPRNLDAHALFELEEAYHHYAKKIQTSRNQSNRPAPKGTT
jgi:hypothetical protein